MSSNDVGEPWNASSVRSAPSGTSSVGWNVSMNASAVRADLRERPFAHGELALGRLFFARVRVEQERVGVAEHDGAGELAQQRDDLRRLGAALDHVAEADDLVDRIALEVREHRLERDGVPVDVGDQRGADVASVRRTGDRSLRSGDGRACR